MKRTIFIGWTLALAAAAFGAPSYITQPYFQGVSNTTSYTNAVLVIGPTGEVMYAQPNLLISNSVTLAATNGFKITTNGTTFTLGPQAVTGTNGITTLTNQQGLTVGLPTGTNSGESLIWDGSNYVAGVPMVTTAVTNSALPAFRATFNVYYTNVGPEIVNTVLYAGSVTWQTNAEFVAAGCSVTTNAAGIPYMLNTGPNNDGLWLVSMNVCFSSLQAAEQFHAYAWIIQGIGLSPAANQGLTGTVASQAKQYITPPFGGNSVYAYYPFMSLSGLAYLSAGTGRITFQAGVYGTNAAGQFYDPQGGINHPMAISVSGVRISK